MAVEHTDFVARLLKEVAGARAAIAAAYLRLWRSEALAPIDPAAPEPAGKSGHEQSHTDRQPDEPGSPDQGPQGVQ